jgi:hypothetical protein
MGLLLNRYVIIGVVLLVVVGGGAAYGKISADMIRDLREQVGALTEQTKELQATNQALIADFSRVQRAQQDADRHCNSRSTRTWPMFCSVWLRSVMRRSLLALLLAGCTTTTTIPVVQPNLAVAVPPVQPMSLYPVAWQVMSLPELQKFAARLEKAQQTHVVVFVLDQQNYTNLMLNFVEVQRYLQEQKAVLDMLNKIIAERASGPPDNAK